jgi:hypothetical protein
MNPQTNVPTPSREGYTKHKRLALWQAAHKQLLRDDAQYRKRHASFLITIACLSCVMLPFYLTLFGVHLFGFKIDVAIIGCVAVVIVILSVRQFVFQNERIRIHLQSSHDD